MDLIFLKPVFKEMIWGGNKLREYGYDIPGDDTGECWAISAHPNGDCEIKNGEYAGKSLSWLWDNHRELFGNIEGDRFPLLIKIIDAKDDLSIQVHPDDSYAAEHENGSLGKTECWYILDCEPGTKIVIGHNAKDHDEMAAMINEGRWNDFIREVPVHKGDFFQIEPGTLHAIKGGTRILETQQNSDITYRVYDYGRLQNGKPRQLHISQSIDVIKAPFKENSEKPEKQEGVDISLTTLVRCSKYTVEKLELNGATFSMDPSFPFLNVSVLEGEGKINDTAIKKGDHFIIPSGFGKTEFSGSMMLIWSYVPRVSKKKYVICGKCFEIKNYTGFSFRELSLFEAGPEYDEKPADHVLNLYPEDFEKPYQNYVAHQQKAGLPCVEKFLFILYILTFRISSFLAKDQYFLFHSACVAVDGEAYLFTAETGVGKSTHADNWLKYFGERAVLMNDDMPYVHFENDVPYVYGSPYMGSKGRGINASYPLKAVCYINRAEKNSAVRITDPSEFTKIINSSMKAPKSMLDKKSVMNFYRKLFTGIGIYDIYCNMDTESAKAAYDCINSET